MARIALDSPFPSGPDDQQSQSRLSFPQLHSQFVFLRRPGAGSFDHDDCQVQAPAAFLANAKRFGFVCGFQRRVPEPRQQTSRECAHPKVTANQENSFRSPREFLLAIP
jgi:hypothetical protein